ncbi:Uma2 family endonuclease [Ornithinimicrobium sp. F0845]|nr:Uma2 family endonuclease [Ornithinimicrobium sp. F0845]
MPVHQRIVTRLWRLLSDSAPADHEVFVAPLDIRLAVDTVVQPDILVAEAISIGRARIEGPPVLAVEVLSRSTRHIDLSP